jgi:uncharacterized ferritin-like protein (DUF455 family)
MRRVQYREFAEHIVTTESVDEKLTPAPDDLVDSQPGEPSRIETPGRGADLEIVAVEDTRVPPVDGYHDPDQRPRILHSFVNHEFQAVELFAWALLAFPDAPADYRRGLLRILGEEQRHTRMYKTRLESLGSRFGEFPVSGYFWKKTPSMTTPLRFVCAMSLTFENANIDHTVDSSDAIRRVGDEKTARIVDQVHIDEIEHVRFGWEWLGKLKDPSQSMWDAYRANVTWPLRPALARGRNFCREGREAVGMDEEFIQLLRQSKR